MLHGLYVITDASLGSDLVNAVALALRGGARIVQYRDKSDDDIRRLREAKRLAELCRSHNALLIINDDIELASACKANGVHIGKNDATLISARTRLKKDMLIGVSCYNDLQLAIEAEQQKADYVALGSFYPSQTKPEAVHADIDLLRQAKQRLSIPVVAIGGINVENGRQLIEAGADMLAVISAVFDSTNPMESARNIQALFPDKSR
ncbi:MAG: thiamine phosphate synthase [Gammaproteobacteria bacterium]|nr:thiamine phosphate synthase [Gammaproteobacteria bacterium]